MTEENPNAQAPTDGVTSVTPPMENITIADGGEEQVVSLGNNDSQPTDQPQDQQQQTQPSTQQPKDDNELKQQVAQHEETLKALEKDLRNKGVDFKQAIKEYEQSGNISDRTIANLVSAGYPKEVIETFLQSRAVLEERFTQAVYQTAGGEKEYFQITQWAGDHLPESTLKAFNKAIDSNDIDMIGLMMSGIKAKMEASRGTANPSILGSSGGVSPVQSKGFASKADMIKAMSDPRYGVDSAYTRSVEDKMYYTNI